MSGDVGDRLREAAARPTEDLDLHRVMEGGKRLRWRRRSAIVIGATCMVAAGSLALNVSLDSPSENPPVTSPPRPFPSASNGAIAFLRVEPKEMLREAALPSADNYVTELGERPRLLLRGSAYRSRPAWTHD